MNEVNYKQLSKHVKNIEKYELLSNQIDKLSQWQEDVLKNEDYINYDFFPNQNDEYAFPRFRVDKNLAIQMIETIKNQTTRSLIDERNKIKRLMSITFSDKHDVKIGDIVECWDDLNDINVGYYLGFDVDEDYILFRVAKNFNDFNHGDHQAWDNIRPINVSTARCDSKNQSVIDIKSETSEKTFVTYKCEGCGNSFPLSELECNVAVGKWWCKPCGAGAIVATKTNSDES